MPQFPGFCDPIENWSKLPHIFIDALPLIESLAELKVVLYILRHTWGYQETERRISLDEFAHGRKKKGSGRIDNGTGLTIRSIRLGLDEAERHGFILRVKNNCDGARTQITYSLAMRPSPPQEQNAEIANLQPRPESKKRAPLHAAIRIFHEQTHRYPPKSWYSEIVRQVGEEASEIERWGFLVKDWVGHGWNPTNVASMLAKFQQERPSSPPTLINSFTNPLTGKVEQVIHDSKDATARSE